MTGRRTFATLDDGQRTLCGRDLLIADGEGGVALAGIMIGKNSGWPIHVPSCVNSKLQCRCGPRNKLSVRPQNGLVGTLKSLWTQHWLKTRLVRSAC